MGDEGAGIAKPAVLIVSDNADDVQLIERALQRQGYPEVGTVTTAADALDQLDRLSPQALLVDLRLLSLDGFALLQTMRRSPRWRAVPVLVLVSRRSAPLIRSAPAEGVSAFITQPFNGVEITYKIEQAVRGAALRPAELIDLRESADHPAADPPSGP